MQSFHSQQRIDELRRAMVRLRTSAEYLQYIVHSLFTLPYIDGPPCPSDFEPPTNNEYESSVTRERHTAFRDCIASNRRSWEYYLEDADDTVDFARTVLEATIRESVEYMRNLAGLASADRGGSHPRHAWQFSAERYVRTVLHRALQRIRAGLDNLLPIELLPDPFEMDVGRIPDLWEYLDSLREEYQERATVLSDVGRALHVMLAMGGEDSRAW